MSRLPALFRPVLSILSSILVVILSSLILVLLRPYLSTPVVALLYLVPVVISAAFWGRLPGISASILSFLIFLFFFVPPYYTFQVTHPQDFLAMIVLLSVAVLISSLMARVQANLAQAQAREREAIQLYRLSTQLAGKNDPAAVAETLAQGLVEILGPARVEVSVIQADQETVTCSGGDSASGDPLAAPPASSGAKATEASKASALAAPPASSGVKAQQAAPPASSGVKAQLAAPPALELPLSTSRGQVGCVRIWDLKNRLSPEQDRLLQTFLSQGALAIDRTILADSETRARVLEESDRLKTAILSSVSHELRTPLATIQTAATSLFNPALALEPAARAELQSLLLEETDRMIQLVGNLLNMSRIEAGALKLQRQWNAFAEIVDTSVRRLGRVSTQHPIQVDVSEDLPLVSVDSVLMEQVMINLIRNSLRFAPAGSTIRICAKADDQSIQVTVSNAGPPIPAEHLGHIFEKFFPLPGKDARQSTGLGLSICKGIVEAHGGRIWAENLPAAGALPGGVAFHFSLPLAWGGARPVLPAAEDEESENP